ncbi:MAG: S4 domain-containing protein, partial [Lentisphaeria bacterium]
MRLNNYISSSGICSRREADRLISQKRVSVNGKVAEIGYIVSSEDVVKVDNKPLPKRQNFVYIA